MAILIINWSAGFKVVDNLPCLNFTSPILFSAKSSNSGNVLPLKLNPQFCQIFMNQVNFNSALNRFIKNLDEDDILIFYSDTPPMFPLRERVHFEDHIDLFFFKKN